MVSFNSIYSAITAACKMRDPLLKEHATVLFFLVFNREDYLPITEDPEIDETDSEEAKRRRYTSLSNVQLKNHLRDAGKAVGGNKATLVDRLIEHEKAEETAPSPSLQLHLREAMLSSSVLEHSEQKANILKNPFALGTKNEEKVVKQIHEDLSDNLKVSRIFRLGSAVSKHLVVGENSPFSRNMSSVDAVVEYEEDDTSNVANVEIKTGTNANTQKNLNTRMTTSGEEIYENLKLSALKKSETPVSPSFKHDHQLPDDPCSPIADRFKAAIPDQAHRMQVFWHCLCTEISQCLYAEADLQNIRRSRLVEFDKEWLTLGMGLVEDLMRSLMNLKKIFATSQVTVLKPAKLQPTRLRK